MNVLISNVSFIVRIGPVSVHEFNCFVDANRVECVIVPKYEFFDFLVHEDPIDFESRT